MILLQDKILIINLDKKIVEAELSRNDLLDSVSVDDYRFYILMNQGILHFHDSLGDSDKWVDCILRV